MKGDNFRIENLRVEELATIAMAKERRRRRKRDFVMVARAQSDLLDQAVNFATERVFRHLLFLKFKSGGKPVRLANAALAHVGIHRLKKWRALRELEALGLIQVTRRPGKSPEIIVLELSDGGNGGCS